MLSLTVPGKDAGSQFTPAPEGVHPAVCVAVIDLGTQTQEFNGETKVARQIQIRFELDTEERAGDRPFSVSRTYTASLHPRAGLRKTLEGWSGKPLTEGKFDFSKLLGKGCQVHVMHKVKANGDTVANIVGVLPLAKGMKTPEPSINTYLFSLDDFDEELFDSFSEGMRKWIAKSPEYQAIINPPPKKAAPPKSPPTAAAAAKAAPNKAVYEAAGFGGPRTNASRSEDVALTDDLNDEIPW